VAPLAGRVATRCFNKLGPQGRIMPGGTARPSPQESAVRAIGAIARISSGRLEKLLREETCELVVVAPRYLFRTTMAGRGLVRLGWHYLVTSGGVWFYSETKKLLPLPPSIRVVEAEDLWVSFLGTR